MLPNTHTPMPGGPLDRPWVRLLLEGLQTLAWLSPAWVELHDRSEDVDHVDVAPLEPPDISHPSAFERASR